jgi:hypothetical protein
VATPHSSAVNKLSEVLAGFAENLTPSPDRERVSTLRRAVYEAVDELRQKGNSSATIQFEIGSLAAAHIDPVAHRNVLEQMTAWCLRRYSDLS